LSILESRISAKERLPVMATYRKSRRDSVTAAPATTFDIGPRPSIREEKPEDGGKL
jgi:hypothetical protein